MHLAGNERRVQIARLAANGPYASVSRLFAYIVTFIEIIGSIEPARLFISARYTFH